MACVRHEPTPTNLPSPRFVTRPTVMVLSAPTPAGSPVPRITVVPSATRRATTQPAEPTEPGPSPTGTVEAPPTLAPSATPTPRIVDAGPTPTQPVEPTPTPVDTLVPTPTQAESPLEPPPGATSTPTPSPSALPPSSEVLEVESVFAHFDGENETFFVAGEVINHTDTHQRITRLMPIVLDDDGMPLSSDDNVDFPTDFDVLRDAISLAPDWSLPFSFKVELPEGIIVEDNYEIQVEAEPTEAAREDLNVFEDVGGEWPDSFFVEGTVENPGTELTKFVAIVVTVYDLEERVIGVGWQYQTDPFFLSAEEYDFDLDITPWAIVEDLELEMDWHAVQAFGE